MGTDLHPVAKAKDGVNEAIEYGEGSVLGVQWHPEMLHSSDQKMTKLFSDLITKSMKEG